MPRLKELLGADGVAMAELESFLDGLSPTARLSETRSLGRADQARLFDAASGHRPIGLHHFVGPNASAMSEVVHEGKNTLPVFSTFAKVFVRPEQSDGMELWGYNRAGGFVETLVGPGYFVASPREGGEVLIDYRRLPADRPSHWPAILSNASRLSAFVYDGTFDVVRGVSEHVAIGRAFKDEEPMSAWFILCRQDPAGHSDR